MAVSFSPSNASVPLPPWNIAYLSQRDVAQPLPINYLTESGIALTAACFGHNVYEDYAAAQCLSNLLAVGFRRFDVDLFWDSERYLWSLCPVQVPIGNLTDVASGTITATRSTTQRPASSTSSLRASVTANISGSSLAGGSIRRRIPEETLVPMRNVLEATQSSATTMMPSKTTYTLTPTISGNNTYLTAPSVSPGNTDELLYSIGPYTCTSTIDIKTLIAVIQDYIHKSDTTLDAFLKYFIFNIHAAASAFRPAEPASTPQESLLPDTANLIGNLFGNTLASSLYTPTLLQQQRMNPNITWFDSRVLTPPLTPYLTVESQDGQPWFSPNGWPDESFLELVQQRRMLLAYGTVDPQMAGYNMSGDSDMLFSQGYIQNIVNVTMSPNGTVTAGCIFNPNTASLSTVNSSWAVTSDIFGSTPPSPPSQSYNTSLTSISNLTACGIAPLLNQTLVNSTADENVLPYRQFAYSAVWTWAYGEPAGDNDTDDVRCAIFNPALEGRWQAVSCTQHHRAACQLQAEPHIWTISSSNGQYGSITEQVCPANYSFATPRTPLENRYLLETFRRSDYSGGDTIWINFNSLDVPTCWVVGVNSTCPYIASGDSKQLVTVPTIAAVIILIIAGLLILVKCSTNRRQSKRSRRGGDGWDYEGVPS